MSEKVKVNLARYTTLIVIYTTDMAYNAIKSLEPLLPDGDKEAKRIYGALRKRYKNFFYYADKAYEEDAEMIGDFSEVIDERIDPIIGEFSEYVIRRLKEYNIDNAELIAKTEIARVQTQFSIVCVEQMQKILKEYDKNCNISEIFRMHEAAKALDDLYYWVTRKMELTLNINENGEIREFMERLNSNITNLNKYIEAYEIASNYGSKD